MAGSDNEPADRVAGPSAPSVTAATVGDVRGAPDAPRSSAPGQSPLATWGPFRLIERVGQGSFGEVFRAFDTTLEREVAVKLLILRHDGDSRAEPEVVREARAMARVRHPNVVPVYGVGSHEGRVGFWSDFVRGQTLTALLAAQGRLGPREATLIGLDVCRAVNAVHTAGLLHRDIKAGNVMREEGGRILLMDFGLSLERSEQHLVGGTPAYMAPELFAGAAATVASDIYAIGVLLYHLLTGGYPVDPPERLVAPAMPDVRPRRTLHDERTDLPETLVRVVEQAIAVDPQQRFGTAGQMMAALSDVLGVSAGGGAAPQRSAPRSRLSHWRWAIPVAALLAIVAWFARTPVVSPATSRATVTAPAGEHATYIEGQALLDRYEQPGNIARAIAKFEETLATDPRFALAHAGLCRAHFLAFRDRGDPAEIQRSQDACATALALQRNLASAHVTLGMLYTQTSRTELATQELGEALALDATNAEVHGALAELYIRQGRADAVEPAFQKAADLAPDDWRWPNQLGYFRLSTGDNEGAVRAYEQAARLGDGNPRVWNNLGIAFRRQGRFADAERAFRRATEIDPQSDNFLSNLGSVLQQQEKLEEAAVLYERSVALNPSNYSVHANLASVLDRLPGEKARARDTYLRAIALAEQLRQNNPKDATLLARLGSYYATVGMADRSRPLLRQAAALEPDDPQVLFRVGEGYELLHQRDEALRWISRALERNYSLEALQRSQSMRDLVADPRFAPLAARRR